MLSIKIKQPEKKNGIEFGMENRMEWNTEENVMEHFWNMEQNTE